MQQAFIEYDGANLKCVTVTVLYDVDKLRIDSQGESSQSMVATPSVLAEKMKRDRGFLAYACDARSAPRVTNWFLASSI